MKPSDFLVYPRNSVAGNAEVLKWYLHLNSGVAHTDSELEKVRQMIKAKDNNNVNQRSIER